MIFSKSDAFTVFEKISYIMWRWLILENTIFTNNYNLIRLEQFLLCRNVNQKYLQKKKKSKQKSLLMWAGRDDSDA